jgi:hypothetical protein
MGHWTLDNAAMNDSFMRGLQTGLSLHGISTSFNTKDRRIMCFPHIVSICTGHMVDEATTTNYSDSIDDYSGDVDSDADGRDVVALCRNTVRAIRASGQRILQFKDTIKLGNEKGWFKVGGNTVQVREVQLLRDVRTRWDSVYSMIQRFLELRPVGL